MITFFGKPLFLLFCNLSSGSEKDSIHEDQVGAEICFDFEFVGNHRFAT
jgi:hypothetical protein